LPGQSAGHALILQRAEEAIGADAAHEVVRAGESRNHFAAEPLGPQDDPLLVDGDLQIGPGDLLFSRRARAAEERDLVIAQDRARDDVAGAALRHVHDLREDGVGPRRLFGRQMLADARFEPGVDMAEASEHPDARRSAGRLPEQLEPPRVRLLLGCGREPGHHLDRIGLRLRLAGRQLVDVLLRQLDLLLAARERRVHLAQLPRLQTAPRDSRVRRGSRKVETLEQRRRLRSALEADSGLFVENFRQRHPAPFAVAIDEVLAELVEVRAALPRRQPMHDRDAALQLLDDRRAEVRFHERLDHVHLIEARELNGGRQRFQIVGDGEIAAGRRAETAGVERGQLLPRAAERRRRGVTGRQGGELLLRTPRLHRA
jgi:hypothetical protein